MDTPPEPRFDRIARLAADLFDAPIALLSVLGERRLWFKARVGLDVNEIPRSISFCAHTIRKAGILVVPDTHSDPRFATNPLVTDDPKIRFYAGAPLIAAGGQAIGALCIADRHARNDLSDAHRRLLADLAALAMEQMDLRRSELLRSAAIGFADASDAGMIAVDAKGRIEFANRAAQHLFGYEQDQMLGRQLDMLIPDRMRGAHRAGMARAAAGEPLKLVGKTIEVPAVRADGSEFPIELSLTAWTDERGLGIGAIMRDISARRERDARLLHLAHTDDLTGLSNRRDLEDRLTGLLARGGQASVILIDLDDFRSVNDGLGHSVGDSLLQAVALRLQAEAPPEATVSRFSGDDFALLLPGIVDPEELEALARTIIASMDRPLELDGMAFRVGTSLGMASSPVGGSEAEELLASADIALQQAKQAGGRTACSFQPTMRSETLARRSLQAELRRAVERGEFELYYQPQIDLADGAVCGMEALLRWRHPQRGLLLPGDFLPTLEPMAITLQLGWWILNEACRQLAEWRSAGCGDFRIAVNMFSAQYRAGALTQQVRDALERNGLPACALELEVTETIALHNDDAAMATLNDLMRSGVHIAFDDFGTGYASLSTLQNFPLTSLKIDRAFVRDFLTSSKDAAIARAMLKLGSDLGLETVAEGIETGDQEDALRAAGCRVGQGYHFGRPMPAEAVPAFCSRPRHWFDEGEGTGVALRAH